MMTTDAVMADDVGTAGTEPVPTVSLVRSYTITAGRTRPTVELPLEARLQRDADEPDGDAPRDVVLRAAEGRSVAEVSAEVRMPVGVVRVLLGDLVEAGLVRVGGTLAADAPREDRRSLIERTLRGLRAL
ncbi:DUF742 domain-containing protein [Nocardioides coralli]|uniref:DUF742 domain-containing protein n=1 Tax=Nocardioides coralli TaxID=2872154 RepID=UPI001CA3FF7C|nr:DUF742 domain-containing protein [Nocardioides coralli]QZY30632.1 DUF742 domain-containing protein [Nocardioides coralli]